MASVIEYPTFQVGERSLIVRYSVAAQILMQRRGIDLQNLKAATEPSNPKATDNWLIIFACMVDENFAPAVAESDYRLGSGPSSDYWATQIAPDEMSDLCRICNEAMGKVTEALIRKRAAASPISIAS